MLITSMLIKFIKLTAVWFNVICILTICFRVKVIVMLLSVFSSGISNNVLHLFLITTRCKPTLLAFDRRNSVFRKAE
jgi:hypothetical protein